MELEYIEEVPQDDYTLTGVSDENYPTFSFDSVYPANTKVIRGEKIYESIKTIARTTWYVYSENEQSIYIPIQKVFVDSVTFDPSKDFEQRYIYLDDTDRLYKYVGSTIYTETDPSVIDFNSGDWEDLGVQLNGYSSFRLYPNEYPAGWKDLGFVNSKKCFDNSALSQTIADGETMVFVFNTSYIDRIAFFDLEASSVEIKNKAITNLGEEEVVINENLDGRTGLHYYEILTQESKFKKNLYVQLAGVSNQIITITITSAGGKAKLGDITLGKAKTLGLTLDGINYDIKEYSEYKSDTEASDQFTEGGYRKISSFDVLYNTSDTEGILERLDSRRGKVTVYNLDPEQDLDNLKIKGFLRTRPLEYLSSSQKSGINMKIEGRLR